VSELTKKAITGTFWTTSSSFVQVVVQILRLSILTRFLDKSDFGLVAIVVLVLGFTQIFTDLGVSVSLFSQNNVSKKSYSSLYWVSLILGVVLYFVLLIATPFISTFYELPKLRELIPIMGLDLIFTTAGRQFRVVSQKKLQFKSLALINIISSIFSLIVALLLALNGAGVYSLILSTLSASFFSSLMLVITTLKDHPLVFYINLKEGKKFYQIGIYQTGAQIFDYIASQIDILIIGKLMTASDLGVYNLVKQLVMRVYALINPIVTSIAIPILAKLQHDLTLLKEHYLRMINVVAVTNFGIYAFIALLAKEILIILYGQAYAESFFVLQLLCIWGAMASIGSAASTIVIIMGRTDLGFKWTILRVLVNPLFIIFGSIYGFKGIVYGQILFAFLFFVIYWKAVVNKIVTILSLSSYVKNVVPLFLSTSIVVFLLIQLNDYLIRGFISERFGAILVLTLFVFVYIIMNQTLVRQLIQFVKMRFR